ncbi:MAG: peptidylprolyl isomerase [Gammaproteobacteria bacterium]|nr:peptidylprolyl isomerase [Gammaproteobacteria bacterium]
MVTSLGNVELAIDELYAPTTAANFKAYVDDSFYDGVIFHRVIDDFMVQSGGFTSGLEAKETMSPIESESRNGLKNYAGRIAMARTSAPHSATSQFFINLDDNDFLDAENASDGWGYTVFGGVISGMDVIEQIGAVETEVSGGRADVPVNEITVDSVTPSSCPAA